MDHGSHGRERFASRRGFDTVRVLARDAARARTLSLPDARLEVVPGDLGDPASLHAAAKGADAVFHVAALYDTTSPWKDFYRYNVEATRELIIGLAPGARMVLTSTYGVSPGRPACACGNTDPLHAHV